MWCGANARWRRHNRIGPSPRRLHAAQSNTQTITPIPFEEMNGERAYNASGVVPLADSRFLFCDNNSGDALFELDLAEDGPGDQTPAPRPCPKSDCRYGSDDAR